MPTKNKLIISGAVVVIFGLVIFWVTGKSPNTPEVQITDLVTFEDKNYNLVFSAPKEWGEAVMAPGNKSCPKEDTYRTGDTLNIFDNEYKWDEFHLENSESRVRIGIRIYRFDPSLANNCNDGLIRALANKETTGAEISSVRLTPISIPGFYGVHNESASRLDTEGRDQYLLFVRESDSQVLAVQPYLSFIPYANSPEWQEIDTKYPMDILKYFQEGKTAAPLREFLSEFHQMAESIRVK